MRHSVVDTFSPDVAGFPEVGELEAAIRTYHVVSRLDIAVGNRVGLLRVQVRHGRRCITRHL
jgi:hypothetical protein